MSRANWKRSRLSRIAIGAIVAGATAFAAPASAMACTQIYVGDQFTADGDTYVGRNEDNAPRWEKVFGVQQPENDMVFSSEVSSFKYTVPGRSLRYTYVRDNKSYYSPEATNAFPEAGENQDGVSVSATESTSYNNKIAAVDPVGSASSQPWGIPEYNLAGLILSQATSAREGVELLGKLDDQYGSLNCNQLVIADKTAVWLFTLLSGHQWIAIKMPDNVVSVNPNMGRLEDEVNIDDSSTCLHSAGLVSTAQKAGSLVTYANGWINVGASYGETDSGYGQYDRLAQGRAYFGAPLASSSYTTNKLGQITNITAPQLTFTPGGKDYTTDFILRAFATRGEGTPFNANTNKNLYAIGNPNTVETNDFQIDHKLPNDIATVQWESLSRPEFGIFIPHYSALLTQVSPLYGNIDTWQGNGVDAGSVDSVDAAMTGPTDNLDEVMMDINTLCYNNRSTTAANVKKYFAVIQNQIIAQQKAVAALMDSTPQTDRSALADKADATVTASVYNKALAMLTELRAYLKSGSSTPFTPSDYDAAANTEKTPFVYAAALINPTITVQPASASYAKNTAAPVLHASAAENDGVNGTSTTLTYTWYKTTDKAAAAALANAKNSAYASASSNAAVLASAGSSPSAVPAGMTLAGTGSSITPSTTSAGTEYYVARVANAQGLYTDSAVAAVTVSDKTAAAANGSSAAGASAKTVTPASSSTARQSGVTRNAAHPATASQTSGSAASSNPLANTGSMVSIAVAAALVLCAAAGGGAIWYRKRSTARDAAASSK